jgi:hypothetical protein
MTVTGSNFYYGLRFNFSEASQLGLILIDEDDDFTIGEKYSNLVHFLPCCNYSNDQVIFGILLSEPTLFRHFNTFQPFDHTIFDTVSVTRYDTVLNAVLNAVVPFQFQFFATNNDCTYCS